jgi:DNA topoisomerase-1
MIKTDYMQKETFNRNFWDGFKALLGKGHVIKDLKKCDFTAMYEHFMAQRELKKQLSKEEKERVKAEKDAAEKKYKTAKVDGRVEQVGNFRVEPPGLFRGRGEHPKMGRIKRRIYPKDIVINIGKGVPIPKHPFPDQHWKMIRHDNTVTWLAFWHDPVTPSSFKYVWLAANSSFKSESDQAKYEKARKLKQYIGPIRAQYEKDWLSKDEQKAQIATALYFIDILALRAGHEKDEEEADTVGCCNLKAENVKCVEEDLKPNTIEFDFLGKDSVQYTKEVEVAAAVYRNIGKWTQKTVYGKPKKPEDQLFDSIDAQDLNKTLKDCMEGLSAKVFRTYNASVTLDRLLTEQEQEQAEAAGGGRQRLESPTVDKRKADYDRANKEVAILCNHQRAVGKAHDSQMEKLQTKLGEFREQLDELQADLKLAKAGKEKKHAQSGKMQKLDPATVLLRIKKKKEQMVKAELQAKVKEDLKTVALGTSKINYLDPRISVSWCKRNEVPMEKIFNKSLLSKFHWAMDCDPDFRF